MAIFFHHQTIHDNQTTIHLDSNSNDVLEQILNNEFSEAKKIIITDENVNGELILGGKQGMHYYWKNEEAIVRTHRKNNIAL